MKYILAFFLLAQISFAQNQNENVLYVVDSVPVVEDPKDGLGTLTENEIDRIEVVKDKQAIENAGYNNMDGIIYVFTKEYVNRPDSIKAVPTTKIMTKKNGTWYLNNESQPYSGPFIDYYWNGKKQGEGVLFNGRLKGRRQMYHINGAISDDIEYEDGLPNGIEKRFYENGTLMQKGSFKNGKEIGVWEMYHPNGQLKQQSTFVNGKMDGESISYYSTGEIKGKSVYKNGVYQKEGTKDKLFKLYNDSQELNKQANFKGAIKKLDKALELDPNWANGYFARGTMKLNDLQFDEAIKDFDKTLEIEPFFTYAYSNRAFAILRKHELGGGRTLSKSKDVQVIVSKETQIPESELIKICLDLKKAVSLGDNNWMVLEALEKYCKE